MRVIEDDGIFIYSSSLARKIYGKRFAVGRDMGGIILNFVVGGTVTALIVGLEESGRRTWSGLAALAPVFTVVSYFFIGASKDAIAVSQHSKFVLVLSGQFSRIGLLPYPYWPVPGVRNG